MKFSKMEEVAADEQNSETVHYKKIAKIQIPELSSVKIKCKTLLKFN